MIDMPVSAVVQIDADAYIAVVDPNGPFVKNGIRLSVYNAMPAPEDCGYSWKARMMEGRVGYTRWNVQVSYGKLMMPSDKDVRAIKALNVDIYQQEI